MKIHKITQYPGRDREVHIKATARAFYWEPRAIRQSFIVHLESETIHAWAPGNRGNAFRPRQSGNYTFRHELSSTDQWRLIEAAKAYVQSNSTAQ